MNALNAYSAMSGAELPTIRRTEFPYFSLDEMRILLRLPDPNVYLGKRDLVLLSFLYDSAARADELCNVKAGDVRFTVPTKVRLRGKGGKTREIPMSDEVAELLKFHIKVNDLDGRNCREHHLFSSQTNEQMTTSCVRSIVEKYVKLAKAQNQKLFQEPRYSPHSFRHSKAVHMAEAGVDLIYIRNFLGHAFISSTEIYARVGQEAVVKALANRKIPRIADKPPEIDKPKFTLPKFIENAR
jgi:site-specific recombinase XerD